MPKIKIDAGFRSYIEKQLSLINDGTLEFNPEYTNFTDEEVSQLVDILKNPSAGLPRAREIVLISHNLGDSAATALASLDIQSLVLMGNNIGLEGAKSLASSASLQTLVLSSNPIGDEGAVALSKSKSIRVLKVDQCEITSGGNALLSSNTLQDLDLSGNGVNDDDIPEHIPENIKALDLSNNFIGEKGAKRLANNSHIERLYLGNNEVGNQGAIALSENKTLKDLALNGNKLGDECAEALSKMEGLEKLRLDYNNFSKQAQNLLFSAPTSKKRKIIDLSNNFEGSMLIKSCPS